MARVRYYLQEDIRNFLKSVLLGGGMEKKALSNFFRAIREDNRIGTSHISLYMALLECWSQNDFQNPVSITRKRLMEDAKINGLATYHKCIRDLNDYGYIRYQPSYDPSIQSKVTLLME